MDLYEEGRTILGFWGLGRREWDGRWRKSPNPKITISALERHGFDDLGTGGIFSIVGLCFQFFLLHLNLFLKIPNPNQDLNRSKNCFLWVRGSCFLGKNYWFVFSGQKVLEGVPRGFS